jgi:hypothetical protein
MQGNTKAVLSRSSEMPRSKYEAAFCPSQKQVKKSQRFPAI